jgi:Methyltransferase domain
MLISPTERLQRLADGNRSDSLSHRLRERRFRLFETLSGRLARPLSIIDIGGTTEFWERCGWADREDVTITLVNLAEQEQRYANITPTVGDATDLSEHPDDGFDIAFSNSVIEHLFTFDAQAKMAAEVRRVATAFWIQTPNFWFPIEPHFLVPAWHWLPESTRVAILQRRGVGWAGRCPDPDYAREIVQQHRLMRRSELARLFPEASIVPERFAGLVKSWTALAGFPAR